MQIWNLATKEVEATVAFDDSQVGFYPQQYLENRPHVYVALVCMS
jgi:hypothetical protein